MAGDKKIPSKKVLDEIIKRHSPTMKQALANAMKELTASGFDTDDKDGLSIKVANRFNEDLLRSITGGK
jgi:hypothetical protein